MVLSSNLPNTYTGTTTIQGGTLLLDYTPNLVINTITSNDITKINGANTLFLGGTLSLNPSVSGTVQTLGSSLNLLANYG